MAKAKASAMALAVPCAEATAFAPLPGWQLEPATRASVLAMAKATASASASALACTAATQQVSVSSYLKWPLWKAQRMNVLNKTPPPFSGAKPLLQTQTKIHAPSVVAIPVQLLRRPRSLGTLQTPHRWRPEIPVLPQIALTRTLSQRRRMHSDSGWHQLHHNTELQPSSEAGSRPQRV